MSMLCASISFVAIMAALSIAAVVAASCVSYDAGFRNGFIRGVKHGTMKNEEEK